MPKKTHLVTLFRGGFSSEVPTFNANGTNIDVSRFIKINISVPTSGDTTRPPITFEEFQQMMAAGTFVQGASIELSADGPMRSPYNVYLQGGLTFEHATIGIMSAAQAIENM